MTMPPPIFWRWMWHTPCHFQLTPNREPHPAVGKRLNPESVLREPMAEVTPIVWGVVPSAVAPVPTTSEWGWLALMLSVLGAGLHAARRR